MIIPKHNRRRRKRVDYANPGRSKVKLELWRVEVETENCWAISFLNFWWARFSPNLLIIISCSEIPDFPVNKLFSIYHSKLWFQTPKKLVLLTVVRNLITYACSMQCSVAICIQNIVSASASALISTRVCTCVVFTFFPAEMQCVRWLHTDLF